MPLALAMGSMSKYINQGFFMSVFKKLNFKLDISQVLTSTIDTLQKQAVIAEKQAKLIPTTKPSKPKKPKRVPTPQQKEFFDMLAILNKKYPKAFPPKGPRPSLKIGIKEDVVKAFDNKFTNVKVHNFLSWYTCSKLYFQNHAAGMPRYDLRGSITGQVTEKEAADVKQKMQVRNERKIVSA